MTRPPSQPIAISGTPVQVLQDIHAQLCLRPYVFDEFHMLVWRHILRHKIPRLPELAQIVNPWLEKGLPLQLCPVIVSFLQMYGPMLWGEKSRSHLSRKTTRLGQQGFWPNYGHLNPRPVYRIDSTMAPSTLSAWHRFAGRRSGGPSVEEKILYSPLGRLMRVYIFAALRNSLEVGGFERAIELDDRELVHRILVADVEEVQTHSAYLTNEEVMKMQWYMTATGGMGGLP
ncbi:Hypothetical predicted protein [Lecanosticta acicola]|uniref:Uncharacterized protein n=1 Tax=Lecanosticta acicola TaxID=111012 RepID=A0AAI9EDX2_9PEZI|nr:Hypothetical predicted protein [Lecanosticta acicola]